MKVNWMMLEYMIIVWSRWHDGLRCCVWYSSDLGQYGKAPFWGTIDWMIINPKNWGQTSQKNNNVSHHASNSFFEFGVTHFHMSQYGGFLSHRGTPSHHPFIDGIFPNKNQPASLGYPHFRNPQLVSTVNPNDVVEPHNFRLITIGMIRFFNHPSGGHDCDINWSPKIRYFFHGIHWGHPNEMSTDRSPGWVQIGSWYNTIRSQSSTTF